MAVVRVHADRVHDAVRRLGCSGDAAVQVVQDSAVDLVEAVASRPETVEDAVGWWFARARALARRTAASSPDLPLGGGVLAVDEDQEVLAEALDQLPEQQRWALLLRDAYDLPVASVGAALGGDPATAMDQVARARLEFLPLVDDEPAPRVPPHQSELGSLARIAEGGPVAAADATARRHALSCESCRSLTDSLQRAHLLLTGLAVAALPERERAPLIARVEDLAYRRLPTTAQLVAAQQAYALEEEEDVEPRLFSPLLVTLSLVLAVLLGLGVGLLLSRTGGVGSLVGSGGTAPEDVELLAPPSPAPEQLVSPPPVVAPRPRTTVFVIPPPRPVPPPPPATPSPTAAPLAVSVDPSSGPDGATLTVTGTGWTPGATVRLEYLDPTGLPTGSESSVVVDDAGALLRHARRRGPERPARRAHRARQRRRGHRRGELRGCRLAAAARLQHLGDEERQLQRLAGVQPRVARRLVPPGQVGVGDLLRAAEALGDVVAGQLDVHAARPRADGRVHLEEAAHLVHDVLEAPRLVPAGGLEGVAVHGVALPDDAARAGPLDGLDQRRQHVAHPARAHAGDERQPARRARRGRAARTARPPCSGRSSGRA